MCPEVQVMHQCSLCLFHQISQDSARAAQNFQVYVDWINFNILCLSQNTIVFKVIFSEDN